MALPSAIPATGIIDNFNRANENPATNWQTFGGSGAMRVLSNELAPAAAVFSGAYYLPHVFIPPFEQYATWVAGHTAGGVQEMNYLVRGIDESFPIVDFSRLGYCVFSNFPEANTLGVRRRDGLSFSHIGTFPWVWSVGDVVLVRVDSDGTHYFYVQAAGTGPWNPVGQLVDGTHTSGYGALLTDSSGNARFDNFGGGNFGSGSDVHLNLTSRGGSW